MDLNELQSARDRERQTDQLQQLRASFYEDAAEFVQQLHRERERAAERADDPYGSPEVTQLTDRIDTAEQMIEGVFEKRIGKIVKAASLDAAGLPAEADGLTAEEQALFETLVADIEAHRTRVLDVLDGETDAGSDAPASSRDDQPPDAEPTTDNRQSSDAGEPVAGSDTVSAADAMGGAPAADSDSPDPRRDSESTPPADDGSAESLDRETVLVTDDDLETFVGPDDRDYDLAAEDVVTLPATNAEILLERNAARRIE